MVYNINLINKKERIEMLVYINEGSIVINLLGGDECGGDVVKLNEMICSDLCDLEKEIFNDMVSECDMVGDDDIRWYKEEIREVKLVDYVDSLKVWISDMVG